MARQTPGPERAAWICPDCEYMVIEHDGNYYCGAKDGATCIEPLVSQVNGIRHVEVIAYCTWYEAAQNAQ